MVVYQLFLWFPRHLTWLMGAFTLGVALTVVQRMAGAMRLLAK